MALIIRQATFEDKKRIFRFLWEVYAGQAFFKFPERWCWLFKENPFNTHSGPCVWLALMDEKIVGQFCGMHVSFKLGNKLQPAIWGVDFIVHPKYRGRRIAQKLVQAVYQKHRYLFILGPSPAASRLFSLLGTEVPVRVSILEKKIKPKQLVLPKTSRNNIEICQISKFGRGINELWRLASSHYYGLVKRDTKYLNWKFMQQPHTHYRAFIAKTCEGICGYVILRIARPPEDNVGLIADLFALPKDLHTIRALIQFSIRYFKSEKVHSIAMATSMHSLAHSLTQLGFRKVGDISFFVLSSNKPRKSSGFQSRNWFLSRGDSDWDQYPSLGNYTTGFSST